MKLTIYTEEMPWSNSIAMHFVTEDHRGNRHIAQPIDLVFKPINLGEISEPTLKMSGPLADQFLNAFYEAIVRSGRVKKDEDKSLNAIKYHLEDMRKLVFEIRK